MFLGGRAIVPLYAARLEDLGPGDLVQLECVCGHSELLTAAMLSTAGVSRAIRSSTSLPGCGAASATRAGAPPCRSGGYPTVAAAEPVGDHLLVALPVIAPPYKELEPPTCTARLNLSWNG